MAAKQPDLPLPPKDVPILFTPIEDLSEGVIAKKQRSYSLYQFELSPFTVPAKEMPDPDTFFTPQQETEDPMDVEKTSESGSLRPISAVGDGLKLSSEAEHEEHEPSHTTLASAIAGAAAASIAAVVGVGAYAGHQLSQSHDTRQIESEDELNVASKPAYDHDDQSDLEDDASIEQATKVSIEEIRTRPNSRATSIDVSRPSSTRPSHSRARSSIYSVPSNFSSDDVQNPPTIGLARSSNDVVPPTPSRTGSIHTQYTPLDQGIRGPAIVHQVATPSEEIPRPVFVLASPPNSKGRKDSSPVDLDNPMFQAGNRDSAETITGEEASGSSNFMGLKDISPAGVPPLTPLREMMEAAHDTSDEESVAPSHLSRGDGAGLEEGSLQGHSPKSSTSSSEFSHGKQGSVASSKMSERRQQLVQPTDRASVQRVFTPPATPRPSDFPGMTKGRRSDSIGKDKRPKTSGSDTSRTSHKLKGLISRSSDEKQGKQSTSDTDENGSVVSEKHSQMVASLDEKERSFEQLIRSDETIQYTLTPQNMREMESPESPMTAVEDPPRPSTQRSTVSTRLNGLRANPPTNPGPSSPNFSQATFNPVPIVSAPVVEAPRAKATYPIPVVEPPRKRSGYIPKSRPPPPSSGYNGSRSSLVAREPRGTSRNSLREVLDFITENEPTNVEPPFAANNRASRVPQGPKARNVGPKSPTAGVNDGLPESQLSKKGSISRARLQAREAFVPRDDTSSDLIDFIRQGPPSAPGEPRRIDRTVAPFRTTMDSDQMSGAAVGRNNSVNNTNAQDKHWSFSPSVNPSVGVATSHVPTGLSTGLMSNNDGHPALSSRGPNAPAANGGFPKKNRRKVRDPYAIDTDSEDEDYVAEEEEEEDDFFPTAKPRGAKPEESLMDFLRSVPPPNQPTTTSVFDDVPNSPQSQKSNGPGLMNRVRSTASNTVGRKNSASSATPTSGKVASNAPQISSSIGDSSLFPENAFSSNNGSMRSQRSYVPRNNAPSRGSGTTSSGGNYQARNTIRSDKSHTNDLIDFLNNSGPPETTSTYTPQPVKEEKGFGKVFGRKKSTAQ
jgi:hypothetical protein